MASRLRSETPDILANRWRLDSFPDLDLMRTVNRSHTFPRHFDDTFVIQVIEQGVNECRFGGQLCRMSVGDILFIQPGDVHTGRSCGKAPLVYRTLRPSGAALIDIARRLGQGSERLPSFSRLIIHDERLASRIASLHRDSEQMQDSLAMETALLELFAHLLERNASPLEARNDVREQSGLVRNVLEYIHAHLSERLTLAQLAAVAGLSPFHFLRVFQKHLGLPPHQYLLNARLAQGRTLLGRHMAVADVAYQTGFADQSHFTRAFRRT